MHRFLRCCCCLSSEGSEYGDDERQPLLQPSPSDLSEAGSARQPRPDAQATKRIGRLAMRRVCVPDLDQRFTDMAETFNEQQQRYEAMVRHIKILRQTYGCNHDDTLALAECLAKIGREHEAKYRITLKIKGYDFSLDVVPVGGEGANVEDDSLPPALRLARGELRGASECAKATISKGTTLQEMIGWLLRSRGHISGQVKRAAATYQEEGRLSENLQENVKEAKRAKELSLVYRQRAGEVLTEATQIAGAHL